MKNRTLLWVEWFSTVDIANENRHETGWFGVMRKQRRTLNRLFRQNRILLLQ